MMTSILALNGGSSSIRFAIYDAAADLARIVSGRIERIGMPGSRLVVNRPDSPPETRDIRSSERADAIRVLLEWLDGQPEFASLQAVGHRVVHGMSHSKPELITPELIDELRGIIPYDPEHLPLELELIDAFRERHSVPQVACFDTAFHAQMPRVAKLLPIPRRYEAKGVTRYGFHGISYAYLMEELARLGDPAAAKGRVVLAHLGNGASLAAVKGGQSVDTSMSFTPNSGFPMSTRSGDLDPGIASYLERAEGVAPAKFQQMVTHESGLLGVSEISSDMRDLLEQPDDPRAREAVDLFCYQVKKWVGAFAAALGGLDCLVFAGGIGENAPAVRARICKGLDFLGIQLSPHANDENGQVISTGSTTVRVIRTNEELMIARSVSRVLGQ
ncbi:MAG: acetate/propionate family kinase [Bryobacteraceae bacterium]